MSGDPLHLPDSLAEATWEQIRGWYDTLAEAPLGAEGLLDWLRSWSRLEARLSEAASLAMIAYTCDTADQAKEAAHLRFSAEILPRVEQRSVALARRLVESGLEPPGFRTTLRRFRTATELFREENIPLMMELEGHSAAYQRLTGSMTADWDGRRLPLPMLSPFLQRPERDVRERAFRRATEPYLKARNELAGLFDRMHALRRTVAGNAGFANYRDYSFRAKFRFDYTPADCESFHGVVERTVVPALRRLLAVRRGRLGVPALRPWDLAPNPYLGEPLTPFRDVGELTAMGLRIFHAVDPVLGAQFRTMTEEGCLDLDSREGKAPGGYCDTLHVRGRPFIFMNASGVMEDVTTLLHEAGHAFHAFAAHPIEFLWQRHPGAEAAELASMSMELIAGEHLARPIGGLEPDAALRVQLDRLEDVLLGLAHIASVDAFQHWIYTQPGGADADARDAEWVRLRDRFEPDLDWSGLEPERAARWYRQLHLYLYPFYYIEYGIAQLGALQVWRNVRRNRERGLRAYRAFLAQGATRELPELYRAAGARLVFDEAGMRELVTLVEDRIAELRAQLAEEEVAPPPATREIGRD